MQLIEQFTERNINQFKQQNLLVINPPSTTTVNMFNQLKDSNTVHFLHHFFHNFLDSYTTYKKANEENSQHTYGINQDLAASIKTPDAIVLYFTKEKKLSDLYIRVIASQFAQQSPVTTLYLLGEKNSGIQSFVKKNALFTTIEKLDTARHCNLFKATLNIGAVTQGPQQLEDFYTSYSTDDLTLHALPGVFSQKKLDAGSALLLPHLAKVAKYDNDKVLDYGCGCGVLSLQLKKLNPTLHIDSLDTNFFSLESTKHNAKANDLMLNQVIPSNGYSQINQRYDWIISNPPFHQHLAIDMQIAYQLITRAQKHLSLNGTLLFVANTFLPYQEALENHFTTVTIEEKTPKYTIYLAKRPKKYQ